MSKTRTVRNGPPALALNPGIVRQIARSLGYVTNSQADDIQQACEYYLAGETADGAVKRVKAESWSGSDE